MHCKPNTNQSNLSRTPQPGPTRPQKFVCKAQWGFINDMFWGLQHAFRALIQLLWEKGNSKAPRCCWNVVKKSKSGGRRSWPQRDSLLLSTQSALRNRLESLGVLPKVLHLRCSQFLRHRSCTQETTLYSNSQSLHISTLKKMCCFHLRLPNSSDRLRASCSPDASKPGEIDKNRKHSTLR